MIVSPATRILPLEVGIEERLTEMKFVLSGVMLRFADYQREIEIDAETVEAGVAGLVEKYPGLKGVLLDGEGRVRSAHMLVLNGENIPRAELARGAAAGDRLEIVTAIAGG